MSYSGINIEPSKQFTNQLTREQTSVCKNSPDTFRSDKRDAMVATPLTQRNVTIVQSGCRKSSKAEVELLSVILSHDFLSFGAVIFSMNVLRGLKLRPEYLPLGKREADMVIFK